MRKTKIVCTIGPASDTEKILTGLCRAGMNVARMNFSHGTHEDHKRRIDLVKKVRCDLEMPIAIMLDTKGPEYRIKTFKNEKITLKDGDTFVFTTDDVEGDETRVSVSYPRLPDELEAGDTILLNNGLLTFKVVSINGADIECEVVIGGELSNRKSMSFPGKVMKQEYLSEQDKKDIAFGVENDVDYIACSFVSKKQDLIDVHNYLKELNAHDIELIAKIENQSGFDNIEEICEACDGIMIARGDMGVEIPFKMLPAIQKKLITKCRLLGKRVITATEMLESMISNPRPTDPCVLFRHRQGYGEYHSCRHEYEECKREKHLLEAGTNCLPLCKVQDKCGCGRVGVCRHRRKSEYAVSAPFLSAKRDARLVKEEERRKQKCHLAYNFIGGVERHTVLAEVDEGGVRRKCHNRRNREICTKLGFCLGKKGVKEEMHDR